MKVIAFHTQHDASVAVAVDGELRAVLELERLLEVRHFESSHDPDTFRAEWRRALDTVLNFVGIDRFDVAVTSWVMPSQRRSLQGLVHADRWTTVDHHRAHALHGLHDAQGSHALIVSYDGGGNDGTFNLYGVERGGLVHRERVSLNLGTPYRLLATTMPEVTGGRPQPRAGHLSLSGKVMAYAALGEPHLAWLPALRDYYRQFQEPAQALYSLGEALGIELESDSLTPEVARALAATSQRAFEDLLLDEIGRHLDAGVREIVLTGGCALNVVANERVRKRFGLPVHVPPAPNDAGIAVGALWSVEAPVGRPPVFSGLPLVWDLPEGELDRRYGVRASLRDLASLLLRGAVVGVAQGRAEHGPRALGHRSILACAHADSLRERINARIKAREWYRPVAPAVLDSRAAELVLDPAPSPYMSFARAMFEASARRYPAATHLDRSTRVQTVTDGFLADLLTELVSLGGDPVLVNTSFNQRGRPLIHRASAALEALDETDLDYVWLDGWLLPKRRGAGDHYAAEGTR